ncbi:MAG: extensin-like domain-containing protein [Hyphomicrobium sp.]
MRTFFRGLALVVLILLVAGATLAAFWLGIVPQRFSPFSPLVLDQRPGWFVDAKLAALRRDPALCQAILKAPFVDAQTVADAPLKKSCGWKNAVKTSTAGGATLAVEPLTCEMAAAVALWVEYELQPAAVEILGSKVAAIEDFGTYDCRKMVGNELWKDRMSEHASANALDIAGFTLADGRKISIIRDWKGKGAEAKFLREAHARACRYFRVTLGPEFNTAHRDHFHFDRGVLWRCK